MRANSSLRVDGKGYISWAIVNAGPDTITDLFFVDLYFDGVMVERWPSRGLPVDVHSSVVDWDELGERVGPRPGLHTLKLVVDSTDLVPETDESDNDFEMEGTWIPAGPAAAATPTPIRLPDLAPYAPERWGSPLVVTSYSGDIVDGPLSVDAPSYIRFGARNEGLTSTQEAVWVYLYLDGLLVEARSSDGLLADAALTTDEWAGLFETINVSPGTHTLRVVIDPHNLVAESDEGNNAFEKRLTWDTGPVPPKPVPSPSPTPALPTPLTLPNLVPGWAYGWDGPIIVSQEMGTFQDGPLTTGEITLIDLVVFNRSTVDITRPFSIDLYFDGEKVHTFELSGFAGPGFVL